MSEDKPHSENRDDAVGELIRLAGRRPEAPLSFSEEIHAAALEVWRRETESAGPSRRWNIGPLATAAALAVALAGLVVLRSTLDRPEVATVDARVGEVVGPEIRLRDGDELETRASGFAALTLAAGHAVRLDQGTRVRVAAGRVELERGAVYVTSGAEARGGIEVETAFGVVRDVGTRFAVRVDGGLVVRVRDGRVTVERDGAVHEAARGTALTIAGDGTVGRSPIATFGPDWDWTAATAPAFDIEGRTLAELLDWLEVEHGWQVAGRDASLDGIVLRGSIAGLGVEEAVAVALASAGLDYRLDPGKLAIRSEFDGETKAR